MKTYDETFDLRKIESNSEDNQQMLDLGIIGFIESAMMNRIGHKVRVIIRVCKDQS